MNRPDASPPFEVSVQRTFAARHAIRLGDGSVEKPHTHDWRLTVAVGSDRLDESGMVMDFHQLEQFVDQAIAPAKNGDFNTVADFGTDIGRVNPTAEQIVAWLGTRIATGLPQGVRLVRVHLVEAPGCGAAWRPQ